MSPFLRSARSRMGSDDLPGDPDYPGTHFVDISAINGYHDEIASGGMDRAAHVVENVEEIELRFMDDGRPHMECGYCRDTHRTRSFDDAVRWWRAHDCDALAVAERTAIVFDLSARGLGTEPDARAA